jgi:hypothetical protein
VSPVSRRPGRWSPFRSRRILLSRAFSLSSLFPSFLPPSSSRRPYPPLSLARCCRPPFPPFLPPAPFLPSGRSPSSSSFGAVSPSLPLIVSGGGPAAASSGPVPSSRRGRGPVGSGVRGRFRRCSPFCRIGPFSPPWDVPVVSTGLSLPFSLLVARRRVARRFPPYPSLLILLLSSSSRATLSCVSSSFAAVSYRWRPLPAACPIPVSFPPPPCRPVSLLSSPSSFVGLFCSVRCRRLLLWPCRRRPVPSLSLWCVGPFLPPVARRVVAVSSVESRAGRFLPSYSSVSSSYLSPLLSPSGASPFPLPSSPILSFPPRRKDPCKCFFHPPPVDQSPKRIESTA